MNINENWAFLKKVNRYLSFTKIKHIFNVGTELFEAANPFLEKPTLWNACRAAFAMGNVIVENSEIWPGEYFNTNEWADIYSDGFTQVLVDVLKKFPYERLDTAEKNTFVRICTLPNGVKCGWTHASQQVKAMGGVYIEAARQAEGKAFIKRLLWEQYKGKSLVMRKNTRVNLDDEDEARVIFEVDDFKAKLSKRATEYAQYLKKPLNEGISRSVMFWGPPGTGKSTLARTIVELMGLRSFSIRISDLNKLDNLTLFEAIDIFEPDAIILDDFDRAHDQVQLLETLEYFKQNIKLVIITVNNKTLLDQALLRPGRIDELIFIDKIDEEVIKYVLGEYVDGYELVKDWPIAFIEEYVKRRKYLSREEAAESVKELTRRVHELSHYNDDHENDMSQMVKLLKEFKETW
jgi:adenylate kinase family enzyme